LISPPIAVFAKAPAKVVQGAVRLHGLASSPTPDTQVRVAWARAGDAERIAMLAIARAFQNNAFIITSGIVVDRILRRHEVTRPELQIVTFTVSDKQ
jgi:hypothetical protein